MILKPHLWSSLSLVLLLSIQGAGASEDLPAPLQNITSQGVNIIGSFAAPGSLTGYVGEYQGQGLTLYTTADGQYAIIGNMIDSNGNNIGASHMRRLIDEPRYSDAWETLQADTHWIVDGDEDAPNVVYTFTDPFCPFCKRMHDSMRPYVESGQVQVRHIMVGIIRENSPAVAATILGSDDPTALLIKQMDTLNAGGVSIQQAAMSFGESAIDDNYAVMTKLNLRATPATFYRDQEGTVRLIQGAPREGQIREMIISD
ncbi:thiol:disulfide interchange protein DsbG [Aliidiomarina minuta]|uniref:Thiol:disulfide interchange protein n=1 Tax=Aliidiomarina minuta TaxID=880057 RepID=A0A432W641_9GAMM|nr:thiol:disulfide interchange protein DsbG [Aliidiomarina minuta]RUO25544.1 thiol:disulfide interchange protein DsbG [Aliidiomarina minuta]